MTAKMLGSVIIGVFFIYGIVFCEPFVLEQVPNILKLDQIEAGLDIVHTYDRYEITGSNNEYTEYKWESDFKIRYGLRERLEIKAGLPYTYKTSKQINVTDQYNKGLGDASLGFKLYAFDLLDKIQSIAIGIDCNFPSGNSNIGIGEGLNYEYKVMIDEVIKPFNIHLNLGYKITGEYTNQSNTVINPGEIVSYGVGGELNIKDSLIPGGETTLIMEVIGTNFGNYRVLGVEYAGTGGTTMEIIPAIRYNTGDLKTKIGISFSMGDPTYRPYAWKLLGGISYLFQL